MLDFELEELNQSTEWRDVLASYLAAHEAAKASQEEFDGWMPRIMKVEDIDDEQLPKIHGKLIALGFLKFQLASRGTGVVYQLSPAGRQALKEITVDSADEPLDDIEPVEIDSENDEPADTTVAVEMEATLESDDQESPETMEPEPEEADAETLDVSEADEPKTDVTPKAA